MERYRPEKFESFPYGGYIDLEEKILLFYKENPYSTFMDAIRATGASKWAVERRVHRLIKEGKIIAILKGTCKLCIVKEE